MIAGVIWVALSVVLSVFGAVRVPRDATIPIHFGLGGQVSGVSRNAALVLFPVVVGGFAAASLFWRVDPSRADPAAFRRSLGLLAGVPVALQAAAFFHAARRRKS